MPRHYAKDVNVLQGTATFDNSKTAYVYFLNEAGQQVSFSKRPFVSLTLNDTTNSPATRIGWLKSGNMWIGAKIKFTSAQSMDVDWEVRE